MIGLCFFLMKLLLCNVHYIELFTRKISMFTFEMFSCPGEITPNSGLTGPNDTYIYMFITMLSTNYSVINHVCVCVINHRIAGR